MFRMMGLELKRAGKGHVWRAFIPLAMTVVIMSGLTALILVAEVAEGAIGASVQSELLDILCLIANITFTVFACATYGSYLVRDYKTKMLDHLFLYPVSRVKIIGSKLLVSFLLSFTGTIFAIMLTAWIVRTIGVPFVMDGRLVSSALFTAITASATALIGFFVGVWRKSTVATVVTGVLLIAIIDGNFGALTLHDFPAVAVGASVIGIILGLLAAHHLVRRDCLN